MYTPGLVSTLPEKRADAELAKTLLRYVDGTAREHGDADARSAENGEAEAVASVEPEHADTVLVVNQITRGEHAVAIEDEGFEAAEPGRRGAAGSGRTRGRSFLARLL